MLRKLLTIGSLFAGIGGFDLGLERTGGFVTEWQCEIDPYCLAVLAKHWPNATRYTDITKLTNPPYVDVLTGGFPCQDISVAGKGKGITGERSGLWKEFARIIAEVKPKYVIIENSPALRTRGLEVVLSDLDSLLYDVAGHCVPASFVGAPHQRDRLCLLAYARSERLQGHSWHGCTEEGREIETRSVSTSGLSQGADTKKWWAVEPNVGRVANGIPSRVDRIKCLGNALVPQVATLLGNVILTREVMWNAVECG